MKFAGHYWRIIRINGDGSIRVIYNGTDTITVGNSVMIDSSQVFNSNYNRSEYVGYMYTDGVQHGNTTDSPIKDVIDNWYTTNIANKGYGDQVSKEAGFCGDREMASGYVWSSQPNNIINYAGYGRLNTNKIPTLKCKNNEDMYTASESNKGNKKLINPIGLISADEVSMAGGVIGLPNNNYYLYTGQDYWTMSPYQFDTSYAYAYVFSIYSSGALGANPVQATIGVRPVINLVSDVTLSGTGTASDPYIVEGAE